jgi:hypothetical protein
MASRSKHLSAILTVLAGMLVLTTLAGLVVSFVPIVPCPSVGREVHRIFAHDRMANIAKGIDGPHCFRCNDRERVTLLSKWRNRD